MAFDGINKHLALIIFWFPNKPTFVAVRSIFIIILFSCLVFSSKAQHVYCFDSIAFKGDYRTKELLLIRELNFQKSDCIPSDSLSQILKIAEQRLFNTQLFNKVSVDTQNIDGKKIVVFDLDERFPIFPKPNLEFADRNFNVWWVEQGRKLNRLNLGMGILHQNVRGRREQLGVEAQIGYTQKFSLSYNIPFLDKNKKHGIGASISVLNNMELGYITDKNKLLFKRFEDGSALRQYEASVWYSYRPKFATTHNVTFNARYIGLHDSIANWYNSNYLGQGKNQGVVLSLTYRVQYNGVDNWNYPLEGFRAIGIVSADYLIGSKLLPAVHWQADWYQKLAPKWYYNFILRGRKSFGKDLPYIMQKNMGYDFDEMRGYEYFVHDGTFFNLLRSNLKYKLIDEQIKIPIRYFRYIPIKVFVKTYADAGYTYNKIIGNNSLNNQMLYSYGIGLDIVTLYDIRIRLEYTMNKNGIRDLYIHKSGE